MLAALAAGETQAVIARRFNITTRTVRRIAASPDARRTVAEIADDAPIDLTAIFGEVIAAQREAVLGLRAIGRHGTNEGVRVGALGRLTPATAGLLDLLERTGHPVWTLRHRPDLRTISDRIIQIADDNGIAEPVYDALTELLDLPRAAGPLTLNGGGTE
ncbi:MAG: hypothetical protein WKF96_13745 [Solirubrobacteraceae bacterium]